MSVMDVPGWLWQMLVVVGGLGLGLLLGGWFPRRQPPKRRSPAANNSVMAHGEASTHSLYGDGAANSQLPGRADTPQQRLLERLRENNLELATQLRASAGQHAHLLNEKDREVAALKVDYDQRVEELRQTHSSELKYLMTLLVEQVDGIHKAHASQVKALEAQIDRAQRELRRRQAAPDPVSAPVATDGGDTTLFAATEAMDASGLPH